MAEIVQCDVHSPPRGPVVERFVEVLGFRGDGSSGEPAATAPPPGCTSLPVPPPGPPHISLRSRTGKLCLAFSEGLFLFVYI